MQNQSTVLQIRKSEKKNSFQENSLTPQANPTMRHHRDRLSETTSMSGNTTGPGWVMRKLAFWRLNFGPYLHFVHVPALLYCSWT